VIVFWKGEEMSENENEVIQGEQVGALKERVAQLEAERMLAMKLSAAGAKDMEAAVLLGMARLTAKDGADVDDVVEEMRKEKGYLFSQSEERREKELPRRSGGERQRKQDGANALERAAKRAASSGSRTDLQEYLRLRRLGR
jgi:hypothetical protein